MHYLVALYITDIMDLFLHNDKWQIQWQPSLQAVKTSELRLLVVVYILFRGHRLLQHGRLLIALQPEAILALFLQQRNEYI